MILRKLAHRYARALFHEAIRRDEALAVLRDLNLVVRLFTHNQRFHSFLLHPELPLASKERALRAASGLFESQSLLPCLLILIRRNRMPVLPQMRGYFDFLFREAQRMVRVTVRSAVELNGQERRRVEALLAQRTGGGTIQMREVVDPTLIGGLTIHYGDNLLDASLRHQLTRMGDRLVHLRHELLATLDLISARSGVEDEAGLALPPSPPPPPAAPPASPASPA